jgi:hypothetical protein
MANNNGSLPSSVRSRGSYVSGRGQVLQNLSGRSNPGLNSSAISIHNGLTQLSNFSNRSRNFEGEEEEIDAEEAAAREAALQAGALQAVQHRAAAQAAAEAAAQAAAEAEAEAEAAGGGLEAYAPLPRGPYNQVPRFTTANLKEYPSLEIAMRNGLVPKGPSKKTRPKRKSRRSRKTRRRNSRR